MNNPNQKLNIKRRNIKKIGYPAALAREQNGGPYGFSAIHNIDCVNK